MIMSKLTKFHFRQRRAAARRRGKSGRDEKMREKLKRRKSKSFIEGFEADFDAKVESLRLRPTGALSQKSLSEATGNWMLSLSVFCRGAQTDGHRATLRAKLYHIAHNSLQIKDRLPVIKTGRCHAVTLPINMHWQRWLSMWLDDTWRGLLFKF